MNLNRNVGARGKVGIGARAKEPRREMFPVWTGDGMGPRMGYEVGEDYEPPRAVRVPVNVRFPLRSTEHYGYSRY